MQCFLMNYHEFLFFEKEKHCCYSFVSRTTHKYLLQRSKLLTRRATKAVGTQGFKTSLLRINATQSKRAALYTAPDSP